MGRFFELLSPRLVCALHAYTQVAKIPKTIHQQKAEKKAAMEANNSGFKTLFSKNLFWKYF